MLKKLTIILAFAASMLLAPATAATAADDNSTITYEGPYWRGQPGTELKKSQWTFRVDVTCDGDNCTAEWYDPFFGSSPATFTVDDPHFVSTRERSGSVCNGGLDYISESTLEMTITADTMIGTLDVPAFQEHCSEHPDIPYLGRAPVIAEFDLVRVAGNPCILDPNHAECDEDSTTEPVTNATPDASGPVAGPGETDGESDNTLLIIAGLVAAGAAAAAGTAAVTTKLKAAKASPGGGESTGSETKTSTIRESIRKRPPRANPSTGTPPNEPTITSNLSDLPDSFFENTLNEYEASRPASDPKIDSETRERMLNQLKNHMGGTGTGSGNNTPPDFTKFLEQLPKDGPGSPAP